MSKESRRTSIKTVVICDTDYECGDGCCHENYVTVSVDGKELEQKFVMLNPTELGDLFKLMGYDVLYEYADLTRRNDIEGDDE